jgi:hypothetical protein
LRSIRGVLVAGVVGLLVVGGGGGGGVSRRGGATTGRLPKAKRFRPLPPYSGISFKRLARSTDSVTALCAARDWRAAALALDGDRVAVVSCGWSQPIQRNMAARAAAERLVVTRRLLIYHSL